MPWLRATRAPLQVTKVLAAITRLARADRRGKGGDLIGYFSDLRPDNTTPPLSPNTEEKL
jgi:hypothetical protein